MANLQQTPPFYGVNLQTGFVGMPGKYQLGQGRKMMMRSAMMFKDIQQSMQVVIKGDEASMRRTMGLLDQMASKYKRIVWEEFKKAIPELHARAGYYATRSGVPWDVLGRYAIAETIPRTSPSHITSAGPTAIGVGATSKRGQMGTQWSHYSKSGKLASTGVAGLKPGSVRALGEYKGGQGPVGFGFKLFDAGMVVREAAFEGTSGIAQSQEWEGIPYAKGWAIPQPGWEGSLFGPSPWFNGRNWPPKSGRKYPHAKWLWREELGLLGTQTTELVKEALMSIGKEHWWPAPEYTRDRISGKLATKGKSKQGGALAMGVNPYQSPNMLIGGIKVGYHWVPPSYKEHKEGKKAEFQPGPGLVPKYFMRGATVEMTQTVAQRCVVRLGKEYQRMSDADKQAFSKFRAAVTGPGMPSVSTVSTRTNPFM